MHSFKRKESLMQRRVMQLGCLFVVFVSLFAGCSDSDPAFVGPELTSQSASNSDREQSVAAVPKLVTKPFRGRYATTFTAPTPPPFVEFEIWGSGVATLIGASTWYGPSFGDFTKVPPVQTGTAWFTAANGDQFLMTYAGIALPGPDPVFDIAFEGNFSISDGTGRFAGATGAGTYEGIASSSLAIGEITYDGTITVVKPPDPPPSHDK